MAPPATIVSFVLALFVNLFEPKKDNKIKNIKEFIFKVFKDWTDFAIGVLMILVMILVMIMMIIMLPKIIFLLWNSLIQFFCLNFMGLIRLVMQHIIEVLISAAIIGFVLAVYLNILKPDETLNIKYFIYNTFEKCALYTLVIIALMFIFVFWAFIAWSVMSTIAKIVQGLIISRMHYV